MTFHEYTVKIRIAEDLTEDGLTLTDDVLQRALCRAFPLARMSGIEVEIVPVAQDSCPTCDAGEPCAHGPVAVVGSPPYPWCPGNPTVADCIRDGHCKRNPNCGE
jgi:hypothetical protein